MSHWFFPYVVAVLFFVAQIVGKLMKFPKKDNVALVIGPLIELPVLSVISSIFKRWNDN